MALAGEEAHNRARSGQFLALRASNLSKRCNLAASPPNDEAWINHASVALSDRSRVFDAGR